MAEIMIGFGLLIAIAVLVIGVELRNARRSRQGQTNWPPDPSGSATSSSSPWSLPRRVTLTGVSLVMYLLMGLVPLVRFLLVGARAVLTGRRDGAREVQSLEMVSPAEQQPVAGAREVSPRRLRGLPNRTKLTALALVLEALFIALSLFWFGPNGIWQRQLGFSVSFLLLPSAGFTLVLSAAFVASWWLKKPFAKSVAVALVGASLSLLLYSVFQYLPSIYAVAAHLRYLQFSPAAYDVLVSIRSYSFFAALVPLGTALLVGARFMFLELGYRLATSLASSATHIFAGAVVWFGMTQFRNQAPVVAGLGIVVLSSSVAMGTIPLAWHGVGAQNVLVAGVCRWIQQSRFRLLNVGLLVGLYVGFIRPFLFRSVTYFLILEWLIAASVVLGFAFVTGGQINRLRHASERAQKWREWHKHQLQIDEYKHQRLEEIAEIQRAFVEDGFKEDLVVCLVAYLRDNRVSLDTIADVAAPVINYMEPRMPRLALWGAYRRARKRWIAERRVLLRDAISEIQRVENMLARGSVIMRSGTLIKGR